MKSILLLREAAISAWATRVSSALILIIVALMCAATLATVGRTAAAEAQLEQRLDAAGARVLSYTDLRDHGLLTDALQHQLTHVTSVERAITVGAAVDVYNGALGSESDRTALWTVSGGLNNVGQLITGRWPEHPHETLISTTAKEKLGMTAGLGWVESVGDFPVEYQIVGTFQPREPFEQFAGGLIAQAAPADEAQTLHVITKTAEDVDRTHQLVLEMIAAPEPELLRVTTPASIAQLRTKILSDLGVFGHSLLVGVLGAGGVLVAVITLADVLVRKKDLGRRRALGADRSTITVLVLLRAIIPGSLGVLLGTVAGTLISLSLGVVPPADFILAVAVLALMAIIISAIPPSVYAASRDPVRVLRTP